MSSRPLLGFVRRGGDAFQSECGSLAVDLADEAAAVTGLAAALTDLKDGLSEVAGVLLRVREAARRRLVVVDDLISAPEPGADPAAFTDYATISRLVGEARTREAELDQAWLTALQAYDVGAVPFADPPVHPLAPPDTFPPAEGAFPGENDPTAPPREPRRPDRMPPDVPRPSDEPPPPEPPPPEPPPPGASPPERSPTAAPPPAPGVLGAVELTAWRAAPREVEVDWSSRLDGLGATCPDDG